MRVAPKKALVPTIMVRHDMQAAKTEKISALAYLGTSIGKLTHICALASLSILAFTAPAWALDLEAALPQKLVIDGATKTTQDYHGRTVNLRSALSKEPLVPISEFGLSGESVYKKTYTQAEREPRVRLTVARKLKAANELLKPLGVKLYILDGYRPLLLQQALWQHFLEKAKVSSPKKDLDSLKKYAARYCSNPENYNAKDSRTWPSHITGGAVDLTLRGINGEDLEMVSVFDDDSEISHTAYFESGNPKGGKDRDYRRLLYNAMHAQGFENYPYEWWHYDYGNQSWSMNSDEYESAFYGPAKDK